MGLEHLEEFARIYLQNDSLVYLLPNVVPGSQGGPQNLQKDPNDYEKSRQKLQRKEMCAALGIRTHCTVLQHKIRDFQTSLYDEVCKRVRTRLIRGASAAGALDEAPPSVRRAAVALQLLSAALKHETKQLTKEGAATAIVDTLCAVWEAAGRCAGCGGRIAAGAGGAAGCAECRSEGTPPRAVLRVAARQFDVEDIQALKRLWSQYREVALQKLRALASAGDDLRRVPVAARPSATDWRVIDLTLLYDDNYKLLTDTSVVHHEQLQPLIVLFSLVQQHGLERGEEHPWREAHRHARNRGACVSLVQLQRRWHELCRAARGAVLRAMRHAARPPPLPPLYQALVRRFPEVATRPLMSWRELVAAGRVYTDFAQTEVETAEWVAAAAAAAAPSRPAPAYTDKEDDLILVEKDIETIELRESDGEADELVIDEDKTLQQTTREEIQSQEGLFRNTTDNLLETDPVKQSNDTVSAMDIDNANVEGATVSNTQNFTNFLVCNENFVNFNIDNNVALNTANIVLGNAASGGVSSNEVPSTSSLNSLDTGQKLSILHNINPECSEAMIIFEDDDDSDEMGVPSGDNSGDERSDSDRCNNAGGGSVQTEDIPVGSLNNEENTNKETVTESQDSKATSNQIVQSDNIDHSDSANHDLNTENKSDEIKSNGDNTNKEEATQKQETEDSENQIVKSNDSGEPSSDINSVDQSNDANHDLPTEDIPTESKHEGENANKETVVESQDTECSKNQIIESDNVVQPTGDTNGVECNHDLHKDDSETQKEVSENTRDENKNKETATENKKTEDSTNQIVESNEKESNQNFEAISKNIMDYKKELKLEIDNNFEVGNSEASSANIVSNQLAIDILREKLGKDITASEDIPKIDNVFSKVSVETKSENEVSNKSTGNSNDAEMAVDTNVVETSESNEADAADSNSDETDSASSMDTTDLTPGVIDPKLLMTPAIPLVRIDPPSHKPSPAPLLVEDFSAHPDFNIRLQGLSDSYLVKNWHLLRRCRPVTVHVERMASELLDRYLAPGRPARRVLLPDIEEVRRANRRLLTAQVAPTPLPHSRQNSDDDGATEQPPPQVDEVKQEPSMPTEEELMNLLQRCEPPAVRRGLGGGKRYCCAARRHRAVNDARARLAARAGKHAPLEQNIHGAAHRNSSCNCCCLHLLPGAADAALLVRLDRRRRRLERAANNLLHRNTEQCDDDDLDDDDDDDDLNVATTTKAKKTWKKKDKQPSVEKEKEPENTEQPTNNDDYSEWIRQKNLWNKYFHIQAIGDETPKTKPTNTDTAHKHTDTAHKHADATTEHNQPISMKTQTQTQKTYVPKVYGTNLNKDTSAATEPVVIGPNHAIVNYSGNFGKTVVAMYRATDDAASSANRKRKSLEGVLANTPSKVKIRIPTQFDKISVDDSEIFDKVMKNESQKQKIQSTSQTVDASVSREDSSITLESAKNPGVADDNNKAAEHHSSDSDDDDFVDRLFIDETAQKLDRDESQNSDFDKLKNGNETNDKSTTKKAYTEDAGAKTKTDTLNEFSQTNIKSNEDAEAGAQSDKSDETTELKLLPSKKVYQKVLRPKLAAPNTSTNSDVTMTTCNKKDIAKNVVGPTGEILKEHLLNQSFKTSQIDTETASKQSDTRADDDSDDDVQIVEPTPAQAKINLRSLLKQQVRATPRERPPTILEQIALMHQKGQKFIIQKVIDEETTPVVYKSETKVNQISRYVGLVPEKPTPGQQAKVVPAGPVVNLNEQLAAMCSPSTSLPYNTQAKPVTTPNRPVITIKQLVPPPVVKIAPKPVAPNPGAPKPVAPNPGAPNPGAQITKKQTYPMPVTKVTDDANKSKYPIKIAQNANAVIHMETTTQKIPASDIIIKTPNSVSQKIAQNANAVIRMETTTQKIPASDIIIKTPNSVSQPMKIGNTTIMRTPKVNVNDTNSTVKVTPPKPEKKISIPVLTIDATKNTDATNINEVDSANPILSPSKEAKDSAPVLTLDATTVPCDNSSINASGLVLKVSQEGLIMSTGDDMATITAVASNDNVGNAGTINNVIGDVGITDVDEDDGVKVDGDSGALPIISNVESLAAPAPAASTIYTKSASAQSGGSAGAASDDIGYSVGYSNRLGVSQPAMSARELAQGRDPTDITVLCVDAARPLLWLRGRHLMVTELEMPCARPQYWARAGGHARVLAFDTPHTGSEPPASGAGGLKVRSFARLPPAEAPPPPPAAAPDRVRSEGKVYKKLSDDPLVYAKVLFVCSTMSWCRRALSSSAFVGLRAPSDEVHAIQRAAPGARAPPASAGLRCDQALPALTDLVHRLNRLKAKPAAIDVISIDSDDEPE